jgi:hypothetical protein
VTRNGLAVVTERPLLAAVRSDLGRHVRSGSGHPDGRTPKPDGPRTDNGQDERRTRQKTAGRNRQKAAGSPSGNKWAYPSTGAGAPAAHVKPRPPGANSLSEARFTAALQRPFECVDVEIDHSPATDLGSEAPQRVRRSASVLRGPAVCIEV